MNAGSGDGDGDIVRSYFTNFMVGPVGDENSPIGIDGNTTKNAKLRFFGRNAVGRVPLLGTRE
ncbi:MAG: hypothetical protein C4527_03440 [Candidatus Omnitrophota bacterium]|nr:MAG: hypothetical protein C4527_03440 [Candidatus Omnitrophota bacterium]